ncbi:MAG: DUF192 domain-containing protein [archaeon]
MKLFHKGKVLAEGVVFYRNPFLRALGLRYSLKPKPIVLVSPSESVSGCAIDMFFVFFSTDVLWLNSKYEVVDLRRTVKPFSLPIKPKVPAKYVVELPVGLINDVKIGDRMSFN